MRFFEGNDCSLAVVGASQEEGEIEGGRGNFGGKSELGLQVGVVLDLEIEELEEVVVADRKHHVEFLAPEDLADGSLVAAQPEHLPVVGDVDQQDFAVC